jgi:hypothetical protein
MPVTQKLCRWKCGVFMNICVFILKHVFASKLFVAVCEVFSNACPEKKTVHQLITILGHMQCLLQVLIM